MVLPGSNRDRIQQHIYNAEDRRRMHRSKAHTPHTRLTLMILESIYAVSIVVLLLLRAFNRAAKPSPPQQSSPAPPGSPPPPTPASPPLSPLAPPPPPTPAPSAAAAAAAPRLPPPPKSPPPLGGRRWRRVRREMRREIREISREMRREISWEIQKVTVATRRVGTWPGPELRPEGAQISLLNFVFLGAKLLESFASGLSNFLCQYLPAAPWRSP